MPSKIKLFLFRLKTENMIGSIVNLDARASRPEIRHAYFTAAQACACGKRTVIHLLCALKLNRAREFFFDDAATAHPHLTRTLRLAQERYDARSKPFIIARTYKIAALAFLNNFSRAANVRSHYRASGGHVFKYGIGKPFGLMSERKRPRQQEAPARGRIFL